MKGGIIWNWDEPHPYAVALNFDEANGAFQNWYIITCLCVNDGRSEWVTTVAQAWEFFNERSLSG
jgi:hypothetical protein